MIGRRVRQVLRQDAAGSVDRGLHVLRRGVDVADELELHRDALSSPSELDEVIERNAGDVGERPLERGRDRCRHRLGTGARQRSPRSGWSGSRPAAAARPAGNTKATAPTMTRPEHQQRRRDRPQDEELGEAHGARSLARKALRAWRRCAGRASTWAPGCSRYWPSTTMRSPGASAAGDDGDGVAHRLDGHRAHLDGVVRRYG